jgi:hypothetical protein
MERHCDMPIPLQWGPIIKDIRFPRDSDWREVRPSNPRSVKRLINNIKTELNGIESSDLLQALPLWSGGQTS